MIAMEPLPPLVGIVLLNYKNAAATLRCLASLQGLDYPRVKIVVVDNASGDDDVALLAAQQHEYQYDFVASATNGGFSAGNNLGISHCLAAGAAFVWILNNDTTVAPDALSHLVAKAQMTHGLVGSWLGDLSGQYQQVGHRLGWWLGTIKGYPESLVSDGMAVDSLSGASMLVPRQVFDQAGLMPEGYFLYVEDVAFCQQAWRAGFGCHVATQAKVFHEEGATTGRIPNTRWYYFFRNRLRFFKAFASSAQWACIVAYAGFRLVRSAVLASVSSAARAKLKAQWLGVGDALRGIEGPCPHALG
jgi:GT2 family glycosyltransferase